LSRNLDQEKPIWSRSLDKNAFTQKQPSISRVAGDEMNRRNCVNVQGKTLVLALSMILLFTIFLQGVNFAKANPMYTIIPPKVTVPEMNVNATISKVDDLLWVTIDAEYQMHTIYGYGDSYLARNTGVGLLSDPSAYVTVTVTQDVLEAHYPIPFNVTNMSVKVNDEKMEWQKDSRGFFHIFDADLQEINWTVAPVPCDFVVTVHYEHPISKTSEVYAYLGEYAFTLPLFGRYGCSNISFPLYSWFESIPRKYNIQIESDFTETDAYSIDGRGTLTPLNYASIENGVGRIEISQESEEDTFFHGAVIVFNTYASVDDDPAVPTSANGDSAVPEESMLTEDPSPVLVGTIAFVATVIGLSLLIYFKKRKQ